MTEPFLEFVDVETGEVIPNTHIVQICRAESIKPVWRLRGAFLTLHPGVGHEWKVMLTAEKDYSYLMEDQKDKEGRKDRKRPTRLSLLLFPSSFFLSRQGSPVPNLDGPVVAGRGQAVPVPAEGDGTDRLGVPPQRQEFPPRRVP